MAASGPSDKDRMAGLSFRKGHIFLLSGKGCKVLLSLHKDHMVQRLLFHKDRIFESFHRGHIFSDNHNQIFSFHI